jgi:hypothetical protein
VYYIPRPWRPKSKQPSHPPPVLPPRYPLQARSRLQPTRPRSLHQVSATLAIAEPIPTIPTCHFTSFPHNNPRPPSPRQCKSRNKDVVLCPPPLRLSLSGYKGEQQIELPNPGRERLNLASIPMPSPVISTRQAAAIRHGASIAYVSVGSHSLISSCGRGRCVI